MEIDRKHLRRRIAQRQINTQLLGAAITHLKNKFRNQQIKKQYGQVSWYHPVYQGEEVHCYVVGRGVLVTSVLSGKMIPKGIEL